MEWYRGDLLELELRTDGAYVLRVRTSAGTMETVTEGSLSI